MLNPPSSIAAVPGQEFRRDLVLRATELHFADGSTMRNDFKDPVLNPKLDPSLFEPEIPANYKNIEPLKNRP